VSRPSFNPRILNVRLSMLFRFYGWRLRRHTAQELLAGGGIAVGVALVFGVLLANTSLVGSASTLLHGLTGSARLQLVARSSAGMEGRLAAEVRRLPGVQAAAGLMREEAIVVGPKGRESIQLIGMDPYIVRLGILTQREPNPETLLLGGGVGMPAEVADAIGAHQGSPVTLLARGLAHPTSVRVVLAGDLAGAAAYGTVAVALLPRAQTLADEPGRVTEVIVQPRPGADRLVAAELRRLAAGRLDVEPADNELRLLDTAAQPTNQSTTLFAAIGAMVGFLLAVNAMLLTVPERRRFIADMRMQGFDSRQMLLILGFQALALGTCASLVGVALGEVLSRTLFHQVPVYLAVAFPISAHQIVHLETVLLALGAGVLATLLASLPPLLDLRTSRPTDAVFREGRGDIGIARPVVLWLGLIGLALIAIVSVLVLAAPRLTIVGGMALALAAIALIPAIFAAVTGGLSRIGERIPGSMLVVASTELRSTATRSIALAGVAALAVYGSVAIGGARQDLLHGLDNAFAQYLNTADIWVTTGGNDLTTNDFQVGSAAASILKAPGVAAVRTYQGALLDVGANRMWIIARPSNDPTMIPASQLLHGDLAHATALLRAGGWAAISEGFATSRALHVGSSFTLPTPAGEERFGVAAITTNLGWPSGSIIINASDYTRAWQTTDPSALEVDLKPGVTPAQGRRAVLRALAGRPGLGVQTLGERERQYDQNARQGLQNLGEIATLLLIAAALSVASALSAVIWQRRARLASLRIQGFDYRQLWRALLLESLILLSIGGADGAVLGVYGHALASRWLQLTTGFPAPFSLAVPQILTTFLLVAGMALAVIALPGLRAARVPAQVGLQE
jgi:putative ABC transport system permease protein